MLRFVTLFFGYDLSRMFRVAPLNKCATPKFYFANFAISLSAFFKARISDLL
jgi:hypothetical protein